MGMGADREGSNRLGRNNPLHGPSAVSAAALLIGGSFVPPCVLASSLLRIASSLARLPSLFRLLPCRVLTLCLDEATFTVYRPAPSRATFRCVAALSSLPLCPPAFPPVAVNPSARRAPVWTYIDNGCFLRNSRATERWHLCAIPLIGDPIYLFVLLSNLGLS